MNRMFGAKHGWQNTAKILRRGGVGILPTDTLYGLVGSALRPKTVARIYRLRRRNPKKPLIVLISSIRDLKLFGIHLNAKRHPLIAKLWPGKVSVILPLPKNKKLLAKFKYLHRGTKTIAFRLPASKYLLALLKKTGPLAAPSANPEGLPPARTIREAEKYFGEKVDFYIAGGMLKSKPSTLVKIQNNEIIVLRRGAVKI